MDLSSQDGLYEEATKISKFYWASQAQSKSSLQCSLALTVGHILLGFIQVSVSPKSLNWPFKVSFLINVPVGHCPELPVPSSTFEQQRTEFLCCFISSNFSSSSSNGCDHLPSHLLPCLHPLCHLLPCVTFPWRNTQSFSSLLKFLTLFFSVIKWCQIYFTVFPSQVIWQLF